MKTAVIALAVVIVVLLGVLVFVPSAHGPTTAEQSGGSGIAQTAVSSDGKVRVSIPAIGEKVASPLTVIGVVTGGGWFFEASFPVKVLDGDGALLGAHPAQAGSDWMVTTPVPFTATITFRAPKYATGTVVLEKDNPSGLPQNAGELRIPIRFK